MKEQGSKKRSKQIVCIIVVIMLCNFIIPNYSYALDDNDGGELFADIAKLLCFVPDVVINFLQDMFITTDEIDETGEYIIRYSPGTIFAGEIPAFSIDFIGANEETKSSIDNVYTIAGTGTEWTLTNEEFNNNYKNNYSNIFEVIETLIQKGIIRNNNYDAAVKLNGETFYTSYVEPSSSLVSLKEIIGNLNLKWTDSSSFKIEPRILYRRFFWN